MLTVVVVLASSGYNSTFSPLSSVYSVTPSMVMTFLATDAPALAAGNLVAGGVAAAAVAAGMATAINEACATSNTAKRRRKRVRLIRPPSGNGSRRGIRGSPCLQAAGRLG